MLPCIPCTSCVSQPWGKTKYIYLYFDFSQSFHLFTSKSLGRTQGLSASTKPTRMQQLQPKHTHKYHPGVRREAGECQTNSSSEKPSALGTTCRAAHSFVGCKQKTQMLLGMAGKTARERQQGKARVMLPATVFKISIPVFSKGSADSTKGTTKPSEMPGPRCLLLSSRTGAPKPPGRPFTITSAPGNTQTLEVVQSPGKLMELLVLDLGARSHSFAHLICSVSYP